jgi:hypothetical protein
MPRIPKRWELTDRKVIRTIRQLAALPDLVRTTKRCLQDMASLRINRAGVCQAICDWIDAGETVIATITTEDPKHIAEPAYEVYPDIEGVKMFVKVSVVSRGSQAELLLIISAHENEGGQSA